jgi:hypothetical protein
MQTQLLTYLLECQVLVALVMVGDRNSFLAIVFGLLDDPAYTYCTIK